MPSLRLLMAEVVISKVAFAFCWVDGKESMLVLNHSPLRLDWNATRSIELDTRGVKEGVSVNVEAGVRVVVGLGVGVGDGAGVELEVGAGNRVDAEPHALKINTAVTAKVAIIIALVFISSPFVKSMIFMVCQAGWQSQTASAKRRYWLIFWPLLPGHLPTTIPFSGGCPHARKYAGMSWLPPWITA